MKRAVFLDRDGVIIRTDVREGKPYAITAYENLDILDGVADAIGRLKEAGYMMIVVSNQPDVAAGKVTRDVVEAINADLMEKLSLDEIKTCYDSTAPCYKPKPGMLMEAAGDHDIDFGRSYLVGDRWRDIGAGKAVGCMTIFIDKRYSEQTPRQAGPCCQVPARGGGLYFVHWGPSMTDPRHPKDMKIKVFADGADLDAIRRLAGNALIEGFTTNPTLMRKDGVSDYKGFALEVLKIVTDRPVSFEVLADEFDEMEAQAMEIASWGANVNVKIPVTNTQGKSSAPLVGRLSGRGVKVNVTAMFTLDQVGEIVDVLDPETPAILPVFAGRVADSGRDPVPHLKAAVGLASKKPLAQIMWASPRELLNIVQADEAGCHIITLTNDVLKKLDNIGKDLGEFSRETVKMFYDDAVAAGYTIPIGDS